MRSSLRQNRSSARFRKLASGPSNPAHPRSDPRTVPSIARWPEQELNECCCFRRLGLPTEFGSGSTSVFVSKQFFKLIDDYKQSLPSIEAGPGVINQPVATGAKVGWAAPQSVGKVCKRSAG